MKRVLIIAYYWPPNGGAGVQRWLKFTKFLPEFGWQPVVYTPEDPTVVVPDPDRIKDVPAIAEVIKRPIREPYAIYRRFTGRKAGENLHTAMLSQKKRDGWRERMALWLRSNFFIPDARVGWVRPSVKYLREYLKEHPVDVIVTTGPPHSMHLIGLALKKDLGIPWVADFRDPWTNIDFYQQLSLTGWADRKHHHLEAQVLRTADRVITVGWTWARELEAIGGRKVDVITNGFDPDDVPTPPEPIDDEFSLVHVGSCSATRNAEGLWRALANKCRSDREFADRFVLRFIGPVDHSVTDSLRSAGLMDHVELVDPIPHHEAMQKMQQARVLLLLVNDTPNATGILTSKLFEYISVDRPILAIGPVEGDIREVVKPPDVYAVRGQEAGSITAIRALFDQPARQGGGPVEFTRRELTRRLSDEILDDYALS